MTAVGISGAEDVAFLYDTAGNDVFDGQRGLSVLVTGGGRTYRAVKFRTTHFMATEGGLDRADFRDSSGSDIFVGIDGVVRLFSTDYDLFGQGLNLSDLVRAIRSGGSTGADTIELNSIDFYFAEIGAWAGP